MSNSNNNIVNRRAKLERIFKDEGTHNFFSKLCSKTALPQPTLNRDFYDDLLRFDFGSSLSLSHVERKVKPLLQRLQAYNRKTSNFQKLLLATVQLMDDICVLYSPEDEKEKELIVSGAEEDDADFESNISAKSATLLNALLSVRLMTKYLSQNVTYAEFLNFFEAGLSDVDYESPYSSPSASPGPEKSCSTSSSNSPAKPYLRANSIERVGRDRSPKSDLPRDLLLSLTSFITNVPVNSSHSYILQWEATNLLLCLFSTQLRSDNLSVPNIFLDLALSLSRTAAGRLVHTLLSNYIGRMPKPHGDAANPHELSYLNTFAQTASTIVLALPLAAYKLFRSSPQNGEAVNSGELADDAQYPLALNSILLLVLLSHQQRPFGRGGKLWEGNAHRWQLLHMADIEEPFVSSTEQQANQVGSVCASFADLYVRICDSSNGSGIVPDTSLLLLYLLMQNQRFQHYVLARTDLELLLVPLLRLLYDGTMIEERSLHNFLALTVLLTLTYRPGFTSAVHKISLPTVNWVKYRSLQSSSLGSLMIIVVTRLTQYNLVRVRNEDVHVLAQAVLCNMCQSVEDLHTVAAERVTKLLEVSAKKLGELSQAIQSGERKIDEETQAEVVVYEDLLQVTLRFIESALIDSETHSPHLIYCLLRQSDLIEALSQFSEMQSSIKSVVKVVRFFRRALEQGAWPDADGADDSESRRDTKLDAALLSASSLVELVKNNVHHFRKPNEADRLRRRASLPLFNYVEQSPASNLLTPFVWKVCVTRALQPWPLDPLPRLLAVDSHGSNGAKSSLKKSSSAVE